MRKFRAAIRRNGDLNFTPVSHYQTIAILDGSYQWIKDTQTRGASADQPRLTGYFPYPHWIVQEGTK